MSPFRSRSILGPLALVWCLAPAPSLAGNCLPPQAGDRLGAMVETGLLSWGLPRGWTFLAAQIRQEVVELKLRGPDGAPWLVVLSDPDAPPSEGDSVALHYFRVRFPAPLSPRTRAALLQVATWIDGGFGVSPWIPCAPPDRAPVPQGHSVAGTNATPWLWHPPRWLYLGLGALALVLLLLALVQALRDPEIPR